MLDAAGRHQEQIETNGVTLRTIVEGEGPLAVLLHGFPRCWYLWRHQIEPLKAAGFRLPLPRTTMPTMWRPSTNKLNRPGRQA